MAMTPFRRWLSLCMGGAALLTACAGDTHGRGSGGHAGTIAGGAGNAVGGTAGLSGGNVSGSGGGSVGVAGTSGAADGGGIGPVSIDQCTTGNPAGLSDPD